MDKHQIENNIEFGIVQGRLTKAPKGSLQWFPQSSWEKEFSLAASLGLKSIEFIAEREYNENNPVWSNQGVEIIKHLTKINNLSRYALCNDYVINHSIIKDKVVVEQNKNLILRGKILGVEKLILPLFEASEINANNSGDYEDVVKEIAEFAQANDIMLCVETILDGKNLFKFLKKVDHPNLKCVFDTGNRAALDQDIYKDILLLKKEIAHVHIKDKDNQNQNVLLGTGKVNFYDVFKALAEIGFKGLYTFETVRGKDPIKTAKYNLLFTEFFINEVQ